MNARPYAAEMRRVLGNLAGTHARWNAALGLLLVGALFGPIFPTLVGILFEHFDNKHVQGTAFGAMFAIVTGKLVVPPSTKARAWPARSSER